MAVLEGKVAVVTGSGQGIGRAIALEMAKQGAKVVTNNRTARPSGGDAEHTANDIVANGGKAVPFFGDVGDFETAGTLIKTAVDKFGRLDILVNNAAGEDPRCMPWEMTPDHWDRTIRTHLTGTFNTVVHACKVMKDQKYGRILNTTSRAWIATTESLNYAAAMAGVVGLTRDVARDMGPLGVTCNAYSPFAKTRRTDVAKFQRAYESGVISKEMYEMYLDIPAPEGCAPVALFLVSDAARDINGQVFGMKQGEFCIFSEALEDKIIRKKGYWTYEELAELVPKGLLQGYVNPAPAKP